MTTLAPAPTLALDPQRSAEGAAVQFGVLESWRGVCAVLVALVHLSVNSHVHGWPILRNGGSGVIFFFVLSGFVMAHAYGARLEHPDAAKRFVVRRFLRLYPLHLAMLGLLVALECVKALLYFRAGVGAGDRPFSGASSLPALLGGLALVNGLGLFDRFTWNGPSWSISTEFWTYLVFLAAGLLGAKAERRAALAIVALTFADMAIIRAYHLPVTTITGLGLIQCLNGFFLGTLVYRLHSHGWPAALAARPHAVEALTLLAVGLVFCGVAPFDGDLKTLVFAASVLVFGQGRGAVTQVFMTPVLRYLGRISYSIYLVHFVLLTVLSGAVRVLQGKLG